MHTPQHLSFFFRSYCRLIVQDQTKSCFKPYISFSLSQPWRNDSYSVGGLIWHDQISVYLCWYLRDMHDNIDRDHDMIMSHFGDTISHAEKIIRDVSSELDPFREVLTRKRKSVNFHTFGPDPPPPLKSVKPNKIFFSHTLTETYFGKRNLFFHLKT